MSTWLLINVYRLFSLLPGKGSLRKLSWKEVKRKHPELYKYRWKRAWYYFTLWLSHPIHPYFIIIPLIILISILINTQPFSEIRVITIDYETAKSTLSNGIEYVGGIIGLCFVIIFFLIEIIKDKQHYTIKEVFRKLQLNFVLSASICILLYFVITSALSSTISEDDVLNLATFSSFLMVVLVGLIGYMFSKLVKLFNKQSISNIVKDDFLKSARYFKLFELLNRESKLIYETEFNRLGIDKGDDFHINLDAFFSEDDEVKVKYIEINKNKYLFDVNLFLLNPLIRRINKFKDINLTFKPLLYLGFGGSMNVFCYNSNVKVSPLSIFFIRVSFHTTKKSILETNYKEKVQDIKQAFYEAAERSDKRMLKEHLAYIRNLMDENL